MTVSASPIDTKTIASSVGILVDRVDGRALGNLWVIDDAKAATCAHLVFGYRSFWPALKVVFPGAGREFGVESAIFHPSFDMKMAAKLAQVALTEPMPNLPLQQHNAAVLRLTPTLEPLSDDMTFKVNKSLSLPLPPRDQGLGGNLGEIDLYVVVQTITNARKEGILTICDERNHPVARVFCQGGRLLFAQFGNLVNEFAIYQIVSQDLKGNFFFWSAPHPNWEVSKEIARPAEMLLIESHRRTDEVKKMAERIGDPNTCYLRMTAQPNVEVLPPEVKDYARMLWELLDGGTPVRALWQLANIDDCAIYQTLCELITTKQIAPRPDDRQSIDGQGRLNALSLSVQTTLAPWDQITNVYRDVASSEAMVRSGALLGTLREDDPWHLIHNIRLVPESAGSPIFKDGKVIGMHCGKLPPHEVAQNQDGALQAMLWVDSVMDCLKSGGENQLVQKLTLVDSPMPDLTKKDKPSSANQGGCREVARIDCPRCGRSSLDAARFCKSCGQRLLKDIDPRPIRKTSTVNLNQDKRPSKKPILLALLCCLLLVGAAVGIGSLVVMSLPPPITAEEGIEYLDENSKGKAEPAKSGPVVAKEAAVTLSVFQKVHPPDLEDPLEMRWQEQAAEKDYYNEGDMIYLDFKARKPGFVYLLYQGSSDKEGASLIYPVNAVNNKELSKGDNFTIPSDVHEKIDDKSAHFTGLTIHDSPGKETLLVLSSPQKLSMLEDADLVNTVFEESLKLDTIGKSGNGVEIPAVELRKQVLEQAATESGSGADLAGTIYIKKWIIEHRPKANAKEQ